jgi:hypothetical protein
MRGTPSGLVKPPHKASEEAGWHASLATNRGMVAGAPSGNGNGTGVKMGILPKMHAGERGLPVIGHRDRPYLAYAVPFTRETTSMRATGRTRGGSAEVRSLWGQQYKPNRHK